VLTSTNPPYVVEGQSVNMPSKRALFLQLLLIHVPFAISQTCVWKDGTKATDYVPCNEGATSGSCCHAGEACLKSGLCYGAPGLPYRGACVNKWGSEGCPTYCDDGKHSYSMGPPEIILSWSLYSCALLGKHLSLQHWRNGIR
jgi:hypothetical protein